MSWFQVGIGEGIYQNCPKCFRIFHRHLPEIACMYLGCLFFLYCCYERSRRAQDNSGKFIHQFQPEAKTLIKKFARILIKLYRQNVSLLFNWTCLNERLLPNHTHTHTHTYIYIYISVATLAYFCYLCPPPPSVNFSSQPVVRGPKVSHHSCYCVILHCIAQID